MLRGGQGLHSCVVKLNPRPRVELLSRRILIGCDLSDGEELLPTAHAFYTFSRKNLLM